MDKSVFEKKPVYTQRPRVDRFVPPRHCVAEMTRRWSWHASSDDTIDMWDSNHQKQKKYKSHLCEAFGIEPSAEPAKLWPCLPRERTSLSSADSILDLPNYSNAAFPELLDWSVSHYLVAALGNSYHIFSWMAQKVIGNGTTKHNIWSCKYDPRGDLLLLGTTHCMLELHNSTWRLCVDAGRCSCAAELTHCTITALHWSPTGNSFVTGCSRGTICTFDRSAKRIHEWTASIRVPIMFVRVSPNARYVAVVTVNSSFVVLLTWPGLEYNLTMECSWVVKTIAWHPWRAALLGVGAVGPNMANKIVLWDAPAGTLKQTIFEHDHFMMDVMLFSHRTGEAVISLWSPERSSDLMKQCTEIVVMSDACTIVDRSGTKGGLDRIRTMVFSPCGTKLATATIDEDLVIWNFLPENYKYKNIKSRRFSALPVYLDQVTHGFVLR